MGKINAGMRWLLLAVLACGRPAVDDGVLYVGSRDNHLYALR